MYKADPYANYAELRPGTASRIADISELKWTDDVWMEQRAKQTDVYEQPLSIYEVHPGSWMRKLYLLFWDFFRTYFYK